MEIKIARRAPGEIGTVNGLAGGFAVYDINYTTADSRLQHFTHLLTQATQQMTAAQQRGDQHAWAAHGRIYLALLEAQGGQGGGR